MEDSLIFKDKIHMTTKLTNKQENEHSCLFNIIFYVESDRAAQNFQKYLDLLKKKFPCRSLFIIEDVGNTEETCSTLLNGIESTDIKPKAACDQITIKFSGKARERIPFLIFSYLVGDLPIYAIWEQDPSKENPILTHLKTIVTKIVFDPGMTTNIKEFSRFVLGHIETVKCGITDFAWFSIRAWRSLLSEIFNTPKKIDDLFHAKVIRIKYNTSKDSKEHPEIGAIYLQAWIAAMLNWKVRDVEEIEGNIRISYERFIHDTVVLLVPEETSSTSASGLINSIEIEANNEEHFLLKRKENSITLWASSKDLCEIPTHFTLTEPTKEQLVLNELFWRGTNNHYTEMLRLLYQTHWNNLS